MISMGQYGTSLAILRIGWHTYWSHILTQRLQCFCTRHHHNSISHLTEIQWNLSRRLFNISYLIWLICVWLFRRALFVKVANVETVSLRWCNSHEACGPNPVPKVSDGKTCESDRNNCSNNMRNNTILCGVLLTKSCGVFAQCIAAIQSAIRRI